MPPGAHAADWEEPEEGILPEAQKRRHRRRRRGSAWLALKRPAGYRETGLTSSRLQLLRAPGVIMEQQHVIVRVWMGFLRDAPDGHQQQSKGVAVSDVK